MESLLIVDNTFATPILCRPFEWGADIITHSTTKYMDGHGVAVGGCIVDSGKFDWTKYPDKFPGLTTPDESYHGITYTERFGLEGAYITKATAQLMRDLGCIQSPQNAFYFKSGSGKPACSYASSQSKCIGRGSILIQTSKNSFGSIQWIKKGIPTTI